MGLSRRLAEGAKVVALAGALLAVPRAGWAEAGVSLASFRNETGDASLGWLAGAVEYAARWHLAPVLTQVPGDGAVEVDGFLSLQDGRLALVIEARPAGESPIRRVLEGDPANPDRLVSSVGAALVGLLPRQLGQRLREEPPTRSAEALGLFLRGLGNEAAAPEFLREALALDPSFLAARWELGLALFSRGRYAEARDAFAGYAEENPADAHARNNLGMCLARLGDATTAMAQFRRALEMDPSLPEARYNLARTLTASGYFTEAEKEYRVILGRDQREGRALLELAYVRERRGDHSGALEVVAEVGGELGERAAEYYYNLGLRRWEEGDHTGARAGFRLALAMDPSDYFSRLASGVVRYQEQDFQGAILEFEEAAGVRQSDPELYRYLGLALRKMGREKEAMERFRTSARLLAAQGKTDAVDTSAPEGSGPPVSMMTAAGGGAAAELAREPGSAAVERGETLLAARQSEIDGLRREAAQLKEELGRRDDQLRASRREGEASARALDTLKEEHEVLVRKGKQLNDDFESLHKRVERESVELQRKMKETAQALEAKVEAAETESRGLREARAECEAGAGALRAEVEEQAARIASLETQLGDRSEAAGRTAPVATEKEVESLKLQVAELREETRKLLQERDERATKASAEAGELRAAREGLEEKLRRVEKELVSAREEAARRARESESLTARLDTQEREGEGTGKRNERLLRESLYGAATFRFGRGEAEGAVEMIEELLRIDPGHVKALYLLSTIHTSRGEFARAREALERAERLTSGGVRDE